MDSSSIDLVGCKIDSIREENGQVVVSFSPAYLIQTMSGSVERTRWRQNGELIFSDAEILEQCPEGPLTCAGGDVGENVYTYRDMIPIPLKSQGRASCDLRFEESDLHLRVEASGVELKMHDRPYYIEHIRAE